MKILKAQKQVWEALYAYFCRQQQVLIKKEKVDLKDFYHFW